jgi:hypothetical protein
MNNQSWDNLCGGDDFSQACMCVNILDYKWTYIIGLEIKFYGQLNMLFAPFFQGHKHVA